MLTKRVIPCFDVDKGRVVKGVSFVELRDAGDPVELAPFYDAEGADELVFLDITASSDDRRTTYEMVERTAAKVFIPFTVGGGVRSEQDARLLLELGADKVSLNSAAVADPLLVGRGAERFGSQCIVVAIDARAAGEGRWEGYTHGGRRPAGPRPRGGPPASGPRRRRVGEARRRPGRRRAAGHEHGHRRPPGRLRHRPDARHRRGGRGAGHRFRRLRRAAAYGRGPPGGGGGGAAGGGAL